MFRSYIEQNVYVATIVEHFTLDDIYEIIEQVEDTDMKGILLDMEDVPAFTSIIIGLLVSLYKNLNEIHVKLGIIHLSSSNHKLLNIAGLDKILVSYKNSADGIAALAQA